MTDDEIISEAMDVMAQAFVDAGQAVMVLAGVLAATPQPGGDSYVLPVKAWEAFCAAFGRIGERAAAVQARLEAEL